MLKRLLDFSLHKKLIVHFSIILLLATVIVGLTGFFIAQNSLNEKGRQILKNSAERAYDIVESQYKHVENGWQTKEDAQEEAKELIMGYLDSDGNRSKENSVDLGKNGYFIIYDSYGNEIMHPTLEGQNKFYETDPTDNSRYIIQEQINLATANEDGAFMTYNWYLLNSDDEIGKKYSYALYFEEWDWIIVATAYAVDFNSAANTILITTLLLILILVILIVYMSSRYINTITKPITRLLSGMEELEEGTFRLVEFEKADKELEHLISGYNKMIYYLKETEQNIKKKNEEMTYLAYHDEMTDLPNFYGMENYINKRISTELNSAAFVLINIRGLNIINALMGYDKGNNLLKEIGTFLLSHNDEHYCSRTSSNEFGIWIEIESYEDFYTSIENLKKELNEFLLKHGYSITANFCIAISLYPEHGKTFEELFEKSTLVMKLIKDSSGTDSGIYQKKMKIEMEEKIHLFHELTQAMYDNEIIPYYQEKTDYLTGKVVGVEALARWHSKKRGLLSPGFFLPLIFEMNLTDDFTNYMIHSALKQYNDLCKKYGEQIDLSINVTPSSFLNTNLFEQISQSLDEFSVPSGKLILEITEDVFVSETETIQKITTKLHNIGVRIAIDDFGTGYSSLNSLALIDFDELKIDKSFIDKILTDEKVFELVNILCDIANLYDYDIVAEGIKSTEQLERLKSTRLRIIQGYLFSKPEPL